jgi:hypothetical protein
MVVPQISTVSKSISTNSQDGRRIGTSRVIIVSPTSGSATCQATSGARRVFCCVGPKKTSAKIRINPNAVMQLTNKAIAISQGSLFQKVYSQRRSVQNPPKGNRATKLREPTIKETKVAGIRVFSPPISVRSCVIVVIITAPQLRNSKDLLMP